MKREIHHPKCLNWAIDFDKTSKADQFKENIAPFESIFLDLGAEILQNVSGMLSLSANADSVRKELAAAIKELSKSTDIKTLKRFQAELKKLKSIGMKTLLPMEGIVFMYNGKIYKLTGSFTPINQLLGLIKYGIGRT